MFPTSSAARSRKAKKRSKPTKARGPFSTRGRLFGTCSLAPLRIESETYSGGPLSKHCPHDPRFNRSTIGAIAQLGERLHGMQEVSGSIPLGSTISKHQ
jgi:hypothetical protein